MTAQELSNTAWALATLHSRRDRVAVTAAAAREAEKEDDGIVRVLRWVARDMMARPASFKPQEISNRYISHVVWCFSVHTRALCCGDLKPTIHRSVTLVSVSSLTLWLCIVLFSDANATRVQHLGLCHGGFWVQ